MTRRLFKFAWVVSLPLGAVAAVLWVRGIARADVIWLTCGRHFLQLSSEGSHLRLEVINTFPVEQSQAGKLFGVRLEYGRMGVYLNEGGKVFHFSNLPVAPASPSVTAPYTSVDFPCWQTVLLALLLPGVSGIRYIRRTLRRRRGGCVSCGYNLTANTSGICYRSHVPLRGDHDRLVQQWSPACFVLTSTRKDLTHAAPCGGIGEQSNRNGLTTMNSSDTQ